MPLVRHGSACLLAATLALSALPSHGEGAVRLLQCQAIQQCDQAGQCQASTEQVEFRMAPLAVDAEGAGSYQMRYGNREATMEASSPAGPFLWKHDAESWHTLLASSETHFLWHQLDLQAGPAAHILFLSCQFLQ